MSETMTRKALRAALTLSVSEYCAALGIGEHTAYAQVRSGAVPVVRAGRRVRIPASHVRRVLGIAESEDAPVAESERE